MTSQDGHPFNPRPLKRRRITHDQLSATLSKERQSIRPLKAENNESNNDEDSEASIDIRRTTPPSRFGNPSPTIGQYDNNFVQNSQANHLNNHQAEEDDIVQTSDIEELLIAEDHDLMSSPHTRRFLLRTSSSSEGHPAFTSPPPTSTASKSRSPIASSSCDMEREQFEPTVLSATTGSIPNPRESTASQLRFIKQASNDISSRYSTKASLKQKTKTFSRVSVETSSQSTAQPLDQRPDYFDGYDVHPETIGPASKFQRKPTPTSSNRTSSPRDHSPTSKPTSRNEGTDLPGSTRIEPIGASMSRSSSSSLLSSAPPSPPRRRTRESNKLFQPYTAYRQQYGDIELQRLERLEMEKEKENRKHGTVEDEIWVASQTQIEEESQFDFINFRQRIQANANRHRPKPNRPQESRDRISTTTEHPTRSHDRNRRKSLEPSRIEHPERRHIRDLHVASSMIRSSPRRTPEPPIVDDRPASEDAINRALQKLYEDDDESDEDGEAFTVPTVHKTVGNVQEVNIPSEEEEETQLPLHRSRVRALITGDDEEDEGGDEHNVFELPNGHPSESRSNSDDEQASDTDQGETDDEVQDKRERILARVWPAILIRKNAEQAKAKELERLRKLRDEERARRAQLGLSDSDMSDVQDVGNVAPGESRTRRARSTSVGPFHVLQNDMDMSSDESQSRRRMGRKESTHHKEIIDISSDQESLDNDLADDKLVASFSSSEETGHFVSDFEAFEDNTIHGYGKSNAQAKIPGRRRYARVRGGSGWNERRPAMRQTRIDRMLNSTRHKSSSSRKTVRDADAHRQGRNRNRNSADIRLPPNTHMVASSSRMSYQMQTRLPFQPIQDDGAHKHSDTGSTNKDRNKVDSRREKASSSKHRRDRYPAQQSHSKRVPKELLPSVFDVLAPVNRAQTVTTLSTSHSIHSRPKPRPPKSTSHSAARPPQQPLDTTGIKDPYDPDAKIDISLRTALAFGARRSRAGFTFPSSSWVSQGKLLDLIHVLSQRGEPSDPLPFHVSTLHLTAETSIPDLQLQFPTICDLLFDMISQRAKPSQDLFTSGQNLMRFVCFYVSRIGKSEADEVKEMLRFIRTQLEALMERVEEWVEVRNRTGQEFNHGLFAIHWFAVELSNRITAALSPKSGGQDNVVSLNDPDTDRYTIKLMSRLLEYGPRRAGQALQNREIDVREAHSVSEYALELWVALVHVITLIPETETDSVDSSTTFWRLLIDALDRSNRPFASAVHESEFIFATIFILSSISSIDALGFGQEQRWLRAYWPIVCRALTCVNLTLDNDQKQKLPQNIVAARDTYVGMLFARCNVLAFRWDWSFQDSKYSDQLLHTLREALKNRKFMNLVHEQSDFPSFIVKQDMNLLYEFDPKDSIQTILIKLMVRKAQAAPQGLLSAKKWISILASTTKLEFRKDTPPTQKELSVLFNQFTIKLVLLYISPNPTNVRVLVNNSKDIIGFKNADLRSRQVCIRAAMIFGRFCQHFGLSPEEPIKWLAEMGTIATLVALDATSRQLKETGLLFALVVASVRDILSSRPRDEEGSPAFPILPNSLINFLAKLLPLTKRYSTCLPEIVLLLKVVFDLRSLFIPLPKVPPLPPIVVEEESQGDYGFEPIDANDPSLIQAFAEDANQNGTSVASELDATLANAISQLTSLIASLIPRFSHADAAENEAADVELWIDCWARIGVISVAYRLKDWEYFLQRSPAALGRLDDFDWSQQMESVYRLRIIREDPKAYEHHKEDFLKVFFAALIARDSDLLPSYIWTVIRIDGMKHPFLNNIPFRRDCTEQEFEEEYHDCRLELVQTILQNADRAYEDIAMNTAQALKLGAEAVENTTFLLKNLRHNILTRNSPQNQGQGPGWTIAESEYARFSSDVINFLRNLSICSDSKISPLLEGLGVIDLTAEN